MNCTARYKSKKTQAEVEKVFKIWSKQIIQRYGGLPPNAWIDFKKGFKRGFMRSCKLRNKSKKR
jgi:hypothetical protein